jgi:hypothetical protein
MSYHNERIGFRFMNLSRDVSDGLRALATNPTTVRPEHGQPDRYVVSFWLEPNIDYDWIQGAIHENRLDESQYGLFVSLVTESDSDIVAVPDFARELFRKVGGRLEFSFTSVEPDDPPGRCVGPPCPAA